MTGLSEGGMAAEYRRSHSPPGPGEGFGSPYQGEDTEAAVDYDPGRPGTQPLPGEMLTAFSAAPDAETDFVRPFLMASDPDEQARILEKASPQMASMMEVGWNYLHDRPMSDRPYSQAPMREVGADLASHPVMGQGADVEEYEIATLGDKGIDGKDAGLGWKQNRLRQEGAVVEPAAIESASDIGQRDQAKPTAQEVRQKLRQALDQMGIDAEVNVTPTGGPSQLHIRDRAA